MKDRKVLDECDGIKCIIMYTDYTIYISLSVLRSTIIVRTFNYVMKISNSCC